MKLTRKLTDDQFNMIREDSYIIHDEEGRTFMFLPYWYEIKNTDENEVLLHPLDDTPKSLNEAIDKFKGSKKPSPLYVYKLKDNVDGNIAFVVAHSLERALELIQQETSISCGAIDVREANQFGKTVEGIWMNNILPF